MHDCNEHDNDHGHDEDIGFLIKQISDRMKAHADSGMKYSELTYSQFHVLGYLARRDGEATQKELEEFLRVAHPTVVGLVGRLEKKGFIETWMDEHDRRIKRIRVTDKTTALRDHMRRNRIAGEANLRRNMTGEEAAELIRLLHIVYDNVAEPYWPSNYEDRNEGTENGGFDTDD